MSIRIAQKTKCPHPQLSTGLSPRNLRAETLSSLSLSSSPGKPPEIWKLRGFSAKLVCSSPAKLAHLTFLHFHKTGFQAPSSPIYPTAFTTLRQAYLPIDSTPIYFILPSPPPPLPTLRVYTSFSVNRGPSIIAGIPYMCRNFA